MNDKQVLVIASIIRVLVTIFILFGTNLPNSIKVILVMIFDTFDHAIPKIFGLFKNKHINDTMNYQYIDKITDTIVYAILYFYAYNKLNKNVAYALLLLYVYRLIGVVKFIKNKDRRYLYRYPNFYLEILLVLFLCQRFNILNKNKIFIILMVIVYKIIQEYTMHYNKPLLQ